MSRVRRALGSSIAAWLVCQMTVLGLMPNLLVALGSIDAGLVMICTCSHDGGEDMTCPMHHHQQRGTDARRPCLMQSVPDHANAIVLSVFGPLGLLPAATPVATVSSTLRILSLDDVSGLDRPAPPDPPPPRLLA